MYKLIKGNSDQQLFFI